MSATLLDVVVLHLLNPSLQSAGTTSNRNIHHNATFTTVSEQIAKASSHIWNRRYLRSGQNGAASGHYDHEVLEGYESGAVLGDALDHAAALHAGGLLPEAVEDVCKLGGGHGAAAVDV
jgi:hypothetical protein